MSPADRALDASWCPVCASGAARSVGGWGEHRLVSCRRCRLVYAMPRPAADELRALYDGEYFARVPGRPTGYDNYRGEPEINAANMWELVAPMLERRFPRPGAILDVGCATGAFLDRARSAGWHAMGVDVSEAAARTAREERGLDVRTGGVRDAALDADSVDVVTLWHVLEHMPAPAGDLAEVRRVLRPGGLLWVELPNWHSIGRRVRGMRWVQIRPPEHLNYFAPRSLRAAVERAGLRVLSVRTIYHDAMARAYFDARRSPLRAAAPLLARAVDLIGWGGYVRLWAEKPF